MKCWIQRWMRQRVKKYVSDIGAKRTKFQRCKGSGSFHARLGPKRKINDEETTWRQIWYETQRNSHKIHIFKESYTNESILQRKLKIKAFWIHPQLSKENRLKKILSWIQGNFYVKEEQILRGRTKNRGKHWFREPQPKREWNLRQGTFITLEVREPDNRFLLGFKIAIN